MIKRQNGEPIRATVVEVVFGVIRLVTERACEFSEICRQSFPKRGDICSVCLPHVAVNLRAQFVDRAALHGLGRLAEYQIEPCPEPSPLLDFRGMLEDHTGLVQAEAVAL